MGGEGSLAATGCVYCTWQLAANAKGNNVDFLCTVVLLFDLFFIDREEKKIICWKSKINGTQNQNCGRRDAG